MTHCSSRVEFYSQIDKNRRNAKNVPLILNEDEPPEPRPAPRPANETVAAPVRTDQNHFYYMFFGKKITSGPLSDDFFKYRYV